MAEHPIAGSYFAGPVDDPEPEKPLHRRMRHSTTKDDYLKGFLTLTLLSGTVAGFLVSLVWGFAVLALLSALCAWAVWRYGVDEP